MRIESRLRRDGLTVASATTRFTTTSTLRGGVCIATAEQPHSANQKPFWQQAYWTLSSSILLPPHRWLHNAGGNAATCWRILKSTATFGACIPRWRRRPTPFSSRRRSIACTAFTRRGCIGSRRSRADGSPVRSRARNILVSRNVPFRVEKPQGSGWQERRHQLEAVNAGTATVESARWSSAIVHHGRRDRLPVAL